MRSRMGDVLEDYAETINHYFMLLKGEEEGCDSQQGALNVHAAWVDYITTMEENGVFSSAEATNERRDAAYWLDFAQRRIAASEPGWKYQSGPNWSFVTSTMTPPSAPSAKPPALMTVAAVGIAAVALFFVWRQM